MPWFDTARLVRRSGSMTGSPKINRVCRAFLMGVQKICPENLAVNKSGLSKVLVLMKI